MCMLDLNKVLIYEFYYDYMKKKYGKNSRILFFNTDNSKYWTKSKDVYKDLSKDKETFDFSKYSAKSKYYYGSNKLVVIKMWNITSGVAI